MISKPLATHTSFGQEFSSELQRHQYKLRLRESILCPCCTNVGSTIVENNIGLPCLHFLAQVLSTFIGSNIILECNNIGYRFDGSQIHTDNQTGLWHVFACDLEPIRRNKQINWNCTIYQTIGKTTTNQPPGAAQRSISTRDFSRNPYFLFNCTSLKAERAR